jgi:predicted nuclease of predicted toxin-antitoxin system
VKRILADENVPGVSIRLLREWDFDVEAITTFDRDFGELIYRRGLEPPPAVIYFRLVPMDPEEAAALLRRILDHPGIQLEGRFSVVMRDQVRQRPLR